MKIPPLNAFCCLAFVFLSLAIPVVSADWSGISVSIEEFESDWIFENNDRNADLTRLNLSFEEKTASELRVGANIGRMTTRLSNNEGPRNTQKFDASYFGIYIRYPLSLGDHFSLQNKLAYHYHSGSETISDVDSEDEIDWREVSYEIGLSAVIGSLRLTPFAVYSDVDGDISGDSGTDSFESDDEISAGVNVDLFLDPTSFVRLRFTTGDHDSASLVFAREF